MRAISGVGVLFFGALFALAVSSPVTLERQAHDFVVGEVVARANVLLDPVDSLANSALLGRLSESFAQRADSLRSRVGRGLNEEVAAILTAACHYCAEGDSINAVVAETTEARATLMQRASESTMAWARGQYEESVTGLVRDLRIFAGVNAGLFLLVLLAVRIVGTTEGAAPRVILWLLLASTALSIAGYVFLQDWFYTFVTGDFVGYGYAAWVGGIFLLLLDWVLNRGRATHGAINVVGGIFG